MNQNAENRENPQDIENAKSHLAKLVPDMGRLDEILENGDQNFLLIHIAKHLEEGQFKLPTDSENQIVQEFSSEDLINTIKILEEQEAQTK